VSWAVNENYEQMSLQVPEFLRFFLGVDVFAFALLIIFNFSI
jgi:hypothetical protein